MPPVTVRGVCRADATQKQPAVEAEERAIRIENQQRVWREKGMYLTYTEVAAGEPCRGCGLLVVDGLGSWPPILKPTDAERQDYEAADYEAADAEFRRRHAGCEAIRWSIQGSRARHCGYCCPPPPSSDEQLHRLAELLRSFGRPDPAELDTWRLILTCDHVVDVTQHKTTAGPSTTARCEQCDQTRGVVEAERICGPTVLLVARAMLDPVYSLWITTGGKPDDPNSVTAAAVDRRLSEEELRIHDEATTDKLPGPLDYPQAIGTPPWGMADWLNDNATASTGGVVYEDRFVDQTDDADIATAVDDIRRNADAGVPTVLLVGDTYPAHYVLVIGHHDGQYQIYNPVGRTTTVTEQALLDGGPALETAASWPHIQGIVAPRN